jgi:hypothetical protein
VGLGGAAGVPDRRLCLGDGGLRHPLFQPDLSRRADQRALPFTRHPAYLSKNLFWWCASMPFLVQTGSTTDAVRNAFFLACVSAIYFWRAKTEERHLLSEDPKYRDYYNWMERNALITRTFHRLGQGLKQRRPVLGAQPAE